MAATNLKCRECRTEYPLDASYVCERCFGPLEVSYDHSALADPAQTRRRIQGGTQNIWRYADFLPLAGGPPGPSGRLGSRVGLPAGCPPLIRADRLAERLGLREVWVKNDAANPTHSFKDRVVSVAVTRARELGFETVVVDGRVLCPLEPFDRVRVERAAPQFKLVANPGHTYYRTLREKLGWGGRLKLNEGP